MKDVDLFQELGSLINNKIEQEWRSVKMVIVMTSDTISVDGYFIDIQNNQQWFPMDYEISQLIKQISSMLRPNLIELYKIEYTLIEDGTFTYELIDE